MKKKIQNGILLTQMIDKSFPLRRREIVKQEPVVQNLMFYSLQYVIKTVYLY